MADVSAKFLLAWILQDDVDDYDVNGLAKLGISVGVTLAAKRSGRSWQW